VDLTEHDAIDPKRELFGRKDIQGQIEFEHVDARLAEHAERAAPRVLGDEVGEPPCAPWRRVESGTPPPPA